MYCARDILREKGLEIFTTSPDASVYEALKQMDEKDVGALLVFENKQLVGIISERDYARKMILKGKHSRDTPVREVMTTSIVTVTPDKDLEECMELITVRRIRYLPVVDGDELMGIISIGDIVKGIIGHKEHVIKELEKYIRGQH